MQLAGIHELTNCSRCRIGVHLGAEIAILDHMRTLPEKAIGLQARVLRFIRRHADQNGQAELSLVDIATSLKVKKSSVQRAIEYLARKELIVVQAGTSYKKSVITINNRATQ